MDLAEVFLQELGGVGVLCYLAPHVLGVLPEHDFFAVRFYVRKSIITYFVSSQA